MGRSRVAAPRGAATVEGMTDLPVDASTARAILDLASSRLAEVEWRLQGTRSRAARLCDEVDWQTPSAREFHTRASRWRDDVAALAAAADTARDHVGWARTHLESLLWSASA